MKKIFKNVNQRDAILAVVFFILFFIIYSGMNAQSQKGSRFSGFSAQTSLSGSGLGTAIQLSTDLELGDATLSFGPMIQFRNRNLSGAHLTYQYFLNYDRSKRSTLMFFGTTRYKHAAFMSQSAINQENKIFPENGFDYTKMKIRSLSIYAGFGLRMRHSDFLCSIWSIGVGGYMALEGQPQFKNMYKEMSGGSVQLSYALRYTFSKVKEAKELK